MFVVYFQGLQRTMDLIETEQALEDLEYNSVTNVKKIKGSKNFISLPLFRLEFEPNASNPSMYNLTNILDVCIKVEAF